MYVCIDVAGGWCVMHAHQPEYIENALSFWNNGSEWDLTTTRERGRGIVHTVPNPQNVPYPLSLNQTSLCIVCRNAASRRLRFNILPGVQV